MLATGERVPRLEPLDVDGEGEYRRPPDSEPDHSGLVMTGTGAAWVSAKVICLPSCSAARSCISWPVRFSRVLKPWVARWPLVVPESAMIVSATWVSFLSDGRPSATPPRMAPFLWRR